VTADELFASLPERFRSERAGDLRATYVFELEGEGGGSWTVRVADGSLSVDESASEADVTVCAKAGDWIAIVEGRMDPQLAYLTKRLRVTGNLQLALRLREVVL
jgi:predicted lipid carrier protein YhbT